MRSSLLQVRLGTLSIFSTYDGKVNELRFYLDLSAERYLRYYQGAARAVSVVSIEGKRVEFPADRLRPFVTHDGVHGLFALQYDDNNRFVALKQLAEPSK